MHPRRVLVGCLAALALVSTPFTSASAAVDPSTPDALTVHRAVQWVATQQQADGSFEVAKFPGFETPEALLSFATEAQSSPAWSGKQALLAAQRVANAKGLTGLDYLDDYAEATGDDAITGGVAAKLITLVTGPLCLDARAFDPQRDGAVDLVARLDAAARPNGAYGPDGVFSDTLYAVLALATLQRPVPAATITYITNAQEADGGWNYAGSADDQGYDDVDTTALAIQALVAAGVPTNDPDLAQGVAYLRALQDSDGSWGFGDPNSTAVADLALQAAATAPAHDADAFLRSKQLPSGRIESPNDSFGVNTYATTQPVRALLDRPLPIVPAAGSCGDEGYYLFAADGGVFSFGASRFYGSAGAIRLNSPIVDGSVTPTGRGYFLFAADGGVFTYGDATFLGSMGGRRLNSPIVAGAATPTGRGYLLFAADGGVFTFGDARFRGSMGGRPLNSPVVAASVSGLGEGYALFAADGGVFTFGDVRFGGSMGGRALNSPIVGGSID